MDLVSLLDLENIKTNQEGKFYFQNSLPKNKFSIDCIINKLSENLNLISKINSEKIENSLLNQISDLENKILTDKNHEGNSFDYSEYDPDDVLIDMKYKSKHIKNFIDYTIKKHEEYSENDKNIILSRVDADKSHNPDDIVCLVCNDGDYEDNDLIVYCSKCQMTVHQMCYGIVNIPEEDWICDTCSFYLDNGEKAKEIECVLCPIKGGAMKPSSIKFKSAFWNYVMGLRKKCNEETLDFAKPIISGKNFGKFDEENKNTVCKNGGKGNCIEDYENGNKSIYTSFEKEGILRKNEENFNDRKKILGNIIYENSEYNEKINYYSLNKNLDNIKIDDSCFTGEIEENKTKLNFNNIIEEENVEVNRKKINENEVEKEKNKENIKYCNTNKIRLEPNKLKDESDNLISSTNTENMFEIQSQLIYNFSHTQNQEN